MSIRELRLADFRCHGRAALAFEPGPTLFVGPNGSGKSALLEAMYFACRLRSFRGAAPRDMLRRGAEGFRVEVATERDRLEARWAADGRTLFLNGAPVAPASAYWGLIPCVALSSGDARLLTGPAGERRRFLSALASQADRGHFTTLLRYGRLARQRQAAITHPRPDRGVWEALTAPLRELGAVLQEERRSLVRRLAALASGAHRALAGGAESLRIAYRPGGWSAGFDDEVRAGRQLVGLQRDEIEIALGEGSARRHGSEGQLRTAAIALRAAEATLLARDTGTAPLVLVDDTFGELDPARRRALAALLPPGVPLFATLTDARWATDELPGARVVPLPLR